MKDVCIKIRIATALVVSKRGGHLHLGKILKDVYSTWIGIWIGVLILCTILFNNTIKCYITMVFPHGQPSHKKISKIGYRDKKGNSYADYQKAVAAAGEDVGATTNYTNSVI